MHPCQVQMHLMDPAIPPTQHECVPVPTSHRSASWVEEMNAELAEFDALTATALDGSQGSGWETSMDFELEQKLASTPQR